LKVVGVKLEQRTVADGKTVWVELERHLFRKDNFEILTKQAAEAVAATFSRSENGSGGFGDLTSIASHRSAVGAELGLIELTVTEPKTDKSGLTVEQLAAVQAPADRDIFISAAAAAGKSKVMVERAVWLVKTGISAKDIVLTTFAVEAANSLKSRLPAALSGIAVGTCHSLAASWGGFDELNPCDFDGMLSRSAAKAPAQRQKIMLVDEAQDLTKLQWQWLRSYGKFLFVVGDDRQSLYSSLGAVDGGMRAAFNESLCRPDDLFAPAPLALSLSLNHRSKSEIVTLGNCIMHAQEPSFAAAAGGKVQVVKVAKRAHEINEILGWALLPLADAIKTRAILARTTAEVSEIRAHLAIHAKDFEDATGIQVLTVHSSKGLEFDSVCYSLGHRKQSELESDAAQCHYVAVTRARSELFVTSAGELPEILGAGFERMCGYIP
jgi:superfamily I DNA/RNA helicase